MMIVLPLSIDETVRVTQDAACVVHYADQDSVAGSLSQEANIVARLTAILHEK